MSALKTNLDHLDDDALVRSVQRGDAGAFESLVDRHLQHVRAFIALKAPVPQLVDEVAHEAFVFAFQNIGEFKAGTSFRAWLRAIAWNLLRQEVQRYSRSQAHRARYAEQKLWEMAQQRVLRESPREAEYLEECLEEIAGTARELLTLKYREERSTEEIARQFQRSLEWVRVTLFRVRQQLKECIERKLSTEAAR